MLFSFSQRICISVVGKRLGFGRLAISHSTATPGAHFTHHRPNPSLAAKCTCPLRATDLLLR